MPDALPSGGHGLRSIRARLALAFAMLLGLALAVAAVTLGRLDDLTAKSRELVDRQARRVLLAQEVNQHAQAAAIGLLKLLQTPRRDDRVPLYAAMDADLAASDKAVRELDDGLLVAGEQAAMARVADIRQRYGVLFQTTVETLEIEGQAPARAHFEARTGKLLNTLLFEIDELEAGIQTRMQGELEAMRASAIGARRIVVLLALAALALGALLAWAIGRAIVTPLREAVALAGAIAGGDYRAAVPCCRNDEFGDLLRSLDRMRDSIASREERILRLAFEDSLTGLPNRTRLDELLRLLNAEQAVLAVLDVHRFAPINHALGHAVGDRVLTELALRLRGAVAAEHLVTRLWGDKFGILVRGVDRATAEAWVQGLLAELRAPITIDGQRLDIDASVGLALYPADAADPAGLLRRANLALAAAKRSESGHAFAGEIASEPPHERLTLLGEMREALGAGHFQLHYQPKLDLRSGCVTGAEALIRWQHPQKGMVPPGRFIPFAEETGFIREITPWALRQAATDAANWKREGRDIVIAVNLSARDLLNRQLVPGIRQLLAEFALPAQSLCLEITESALMDDPALALAHLNELAALGLKLAIDDYGTGQASLAYVKTLPVHELKVDRSFVQDVDAAPRNAAILRSTLLMCRELGLTVVAEGAETEAELAWLRTSGCDTVQGYAVARPMPIDAFLAWADKRLAAA